MRRNHLVGMLMAGDILVALLVGTQCYARRHASVHHFDPEPVIVAWLVWAVLVGATVGCLPRRRPAPVSGAFGTAAWGDGRGLVHADGLLLGRAAGGIMRYAGDGHLVTVAPTRSGKGVSAVIPNLLGFPGSIVVTDPKGENYAVTARHRRIIGSRLLAYDPFGVVVPPGAAATFNPLDEVGGVDEARLLADMIVITDGRAEPFWEEEARAVLVGLILHAVAQPDPVRRTLLTVREWLTLPPRELRALLTRMSADPSAGGLVRRAAAQLTQKSPRERAAVMSTAQSHTHFLDSPAMATALGASTAQPTFDNTTIYLILPPDRMDGYRRWLRLMIGSLLYGIIRSRRSRVLFLLDEFAHLGRMRPVEQGVSLVGGYGVRFWLLLQDLAQLRAVYGDAWPTFLANADVLQAFGINDYETAEHLSKLAGETTVRVATESRSRGVSRGRLESTQDGEGLSMSERGRRLVTADEVRRLGADRQLLFVRGQAPIVARRLDYRSDREFAGRADPNPLARV